MRAKMPSAAVKRAKNKNWGQRRILPALFPVTLGVRKSVSDPNFLGAIFDITQDTIPGGVRGDSLHRGDFTREIAVGGFQQHGFLERKAGLFFPARQTAHHFAQFEKGAGIDAALDVLAARGPITAGDAALALGGENLEQLLEFLPAQQWADATFFKIGFRHLDGHLRVLDANDKTGLDLAGEINVLDCQYDADSGGRIKNRFTDLETRAFCHAAILLGYDT